MKRNSILFTILMLITLNSIAQAQLWQQTNGVGTDYINSIAVNSQGHIFLCGRSLIRSTDGGVSWTRLLTTIPLGNCFNIHAQPSGRLLLTIGVDNGSYVSTDSLLASDDNGDTWKRLSVKTGTYWVGAGATVFADDDGTYVRSSDNGDTWSTLSVSGIVGGIGSMFSDRAGHMFVSADYLYRSTDNGVSWAKVVNGLSVHRYEGPVYIVEAASGDLYAYQYMESLFRSTDGGRTWSSPNGVVASYVSAVLTTLSQTSITVSSEGGVQYSSDNGNTWKRAESVGIPNGAFAAEPSGAILYSSPESEILTRWLPGSTPVRLGASNGRVLALVAHPNGSLLAADYGGQGGWPWMSTDQGTSWSAVADRFAANTMTLDSAGDILAGYAQSIIVSTDSGKTWGSGSPALTSGNTTGIAVRFNGDIFVASSNEGVFRSTDRGKTWDQLTSGMPTQPLGSLAVHQNGDVYAGAYQDIYRSTNDGLTWTSLKPGFPSAAGGVTSLVVNTQGVIIAGVAGAGVWLSTDNGATWAQKATGITAKQINTLLSTPSGKVFAGTEAGVFFLDTAAGSNWIPYSLGITAPNVLSLCRDNSGRIYAGTDGSGVFRSVQTFNKIVPASAPVAMLTSNDVEFSSVFLGQTHDSVLDGLLASGGGDPLSVLGVSMVTTSGTAQDFELKNLPPMPYAISAGKPLGLTVAVHPKISGHSSALVHLYTNAPEAAETVVLNADAIDGSADVKPGIVSPNEGLAVVYPNPATTSATVSYTLSGRSTVQVSLVDPLGRSLLHITDAVQDAGAHTAKFDVSALPAGMYFVRFEAGSARTLKPLVVTR